MNGSRKNLVWIKLVVLVLILGGLTFWLYDSGLIKIFFSKRRLLHFLGSLGSWGPVGFLVLQSLQVVISPIPGDVTGLLGGFLYGPWFAVLLSTIGLTLGSCAAFALSRNFGRPFAEKFVPQAALKRFDYLIENKGAFLAFLLFLIPGFPKDYFCYIFGLGKMPAVQFVVVSTVGRLFGTILLSLCGSCIRLRQYTHLSILIGISVILICVAVVFRDKLEDGFRRLQVKSTGRGSRKDLHAGA